MKIIFRTLLIISMLFAIETIGTPCYAQGWAKGLSKLSKAISKTGKVAGKGAKKVAPFADDAVRAAQRTKTSSTGISSSCTACRGTASPYQLQKCGFCKFGRTSSGYTCCICGGSGYVYACHKCRKIHHHK